MGYLKVRLDDGKTVSAGEFSRLQAAQKKSEYQVVRRRPTLNAGPLALPPRIVTAQDADKDTRQVQVMPQLGPRSFYQPVHPPDEEVGRRTPDYSGQGEVIPIGHAGWPPVPHAKQSPGGPLPPPVVLGQAEGKDARTKKDGDAMPVPPPVATR